MTFASRRTLGRTGITMPQLGFGGAPLGAASTVPESRARATLKAAWDGGIRYYDTAPFYGSGLSEHRIGSFLRQKPRDGFLLSTKVGRVNTARPTHAAESEEWAPWGLPFQSRFDYTYDGIMRSYEDSTQRLSLSRIDLLLIHDLDFSYHKTESGVDARLSELDSGWKALDQLRSSGLVSGIGAGINEEAMMLKLLEHGDLDFFLVALPYTLLEQRTLDREFPECEKRGIGVIIGAPYGSGILATGAVPSARYGYRAAPAEVLARVAAIENVCARYRVPLKAAALQFPLGHPVVASVIPGMRSGEEARDNIEMSSVPIPNAFWEALKDEGLIRSDAPVPIGAD